MYIRKDNKVKNVFTVELSDEMSGENITLNVYQPKLALIRKLKSISQGEGIDIIDRMLDILASALSRNTEGRQIDADFLADILDTEDMSALFEDFFQWVNELKKK